MAEYLKDRAAKIRADAATLCATLAKEVIAAGEAVRDRLHGAAGDDRAIASPDTIDALDRLDLAIRELWRAREIAREVSYALGEVQGRDGAK